MMYMYVHVPSGLCVQCACGADEPEPGKWSAQSLPPLRTHNAMSIFMHVLHVHYMYMYNGHVYNMYMNNHVYRNTFQI